MPTDPLSTTSTPAPEVSSDAQSHHVRAAYERCLPAMMALNEASLRHPNLDVIEKMVIVLQALPLLATLRETIATSLPKHDMAAFDVLGEQARALIHAQAELQASEEDENEELKALTDEGAGLREVLFGDAEALRGRTLIAKDALENVHKATGAKAVASELLTLVSVVRKAWPRAQARTAITLDELQQAEDLANRILAALTTVKLEGAEARQASLMRKRAFTLFITNYTETRRAVEYVRFYEEDADRFCPSLWTGRRSKKNAQPEQDEKPQPPAPDAEPAPASPGGPGLPGGNPFSG